MPNNIELKNQYFNAREFNEIAKLNDLIQKVDNNYLQIKSQY